MTVDKTPDRVRGMFNEISPRYDLLNRCLSLGIDRYWRRRTTRILQPKSGDSILDVCCGTGDLSLALWRASRRQAEVKGVDFAAGMLEIARKKFEAACRKSIKGNAKGSGKPSETEAAIEFIEADAMRLPFEANRFDIVSVAFGLRNICDFQVGLTEMARVCRSGGQVAVLEFSSPRGLILGPLFNWYFRNILPRIGQAIARNRYRAYEYLPQSVGEFPQGEELAQYMKSAGMTDVFYRPLTFGIATLYVGRKP